MTDKAELQSLKELIEENRRHCDHTKLNLTHHISMLSETMGRHQKAQEIIEASIARLDSKTSSNFHEISASLSALKVAQAESTMSHKSNSFLIKWVMGICTSLFVASLVSYISAKGG